jgi:TPR repeat protein
MISMIARYARSLLLAFLILGSAAGAALSATSTTAPDAATIALPSIEQANKLSARQRLALAAKLVLSAELIERQLAFQLLLPMAEQGNRAATRLLAKGVGKFPETLGEDAARARRPLGREAVLGSTSAIYAIARMHDLGIGASKDPAEALSWYRWAAVRGLSSAIQRMALALTTGEFGTKDIPQAHRWVLKLSKPQQTSTLVAMATALYGAASESDSATADSYLAEALAAEAPASVSAAVLALKTSRSSDLLASAQLYLDKAIAAGNIEAITALASTSATASTESLQNAVRVLGALAAKANQPAIDQLIRLLHVEGLPSSIGQQVVAALTTAADAGNVAAAKTVAAALTLGSGASVSFANAAKYLEIAATGGDADAAYQLGMLYYSGLGIEADKTEGRKWLEKSAASGSKLAIAVLQSL